MEKQLVEVSEEEAFLNGNFTVTWLYNDMPWAEACANPCVDEDTVGVYVPDRFCSEMLSTRAWFSDGNDSEVDDVKFFIVKEKESE